MRAGPAGVFEDIVSKDALVLQKCWYQWTVLDTGTTYPCSATVCVQHALVNLFTCRWTCSCIYRRNA